MIRIFQQKVDYLKALNEQQEAITAPDFENQIWLLEHTPVFTTGISAQDSDILIKSDIPIIKTNRGGKITYHAPGQLICYLLFDLKNIPIKELVRTTESVIISYLDSLSIPNSYVIEGSPGVFIDGKKIASLGFAIKNRRTYHGFSLNMDMDMKPFTYINPCGLAGMKMAQTTNYNKNAKINTDNINKLIKILLSSFKKTSIDTTTLASKIHHLA